MKRLVLKIAILAVLCMVVAGCGKQGASAEEVLATQDSGTVVETAEESSMEEVTEKEDVEVASKEGNATDESQEAVVETAEAKVAETETIEETVAEAAGAEAGKETLAGEASTESAEAGTTDEMPAESAETEQQASENGAKKTFAVTRFEEAKTLYATIALNIRRGPGTDYEKAGNLALADEIKALGQADNGWYFFMKNGEAVYASDAYLSETKPELPPLVAEAPAQTAPTPQQVPAQAVAAPAGVIMVGDSRCVQMQEAVGGGGCSWICENSKEYTWFIEKAIPRFDQYVGKGTKVVINMGVNDPEHYKDYVATVNAKAAEWAGRGARTYFVSVNPVWENPYTDQADVDTFNANVPGMLSGVTWIDTSSWLNANGYRLVDGLHYDAPTYVNIFNLIMGSL